MKIQDWIPLGDCSGWIDPEGTVHKVAYFDHLKFFENHPEMGDAYCSYRNQIKANEEEVEQILADLEPGEHPAMHRFASIDDEANDDLYLHAYTSGWIRYGVHTHNYRKVKHYKLELYGTQEHLDKIEKYLKILGKDLDATIMLFYVVENTDWRGRKYKMKHRKIWDTKKGELL